MNSSRFSGQVATDFRMTRPQGVLLLGGQVLPDGLGPKVTGAKRTGRGTGQNYCIFDLSPVEKDGDKTENTLRKNRALRLERS